MKQQRETKRTEFSQRGEPFEFSVQAQTKCFSFRVTFRIPVVRGKNLDIGSAHSRNPRPIVMRRGVAWRGEAGGGGGARVDVPLVLMLIQVGKEPPL